MSMALRRFTEHTPPLVKIKEMAADHPAVLAGGTIYPARITWPGFSDRLLKSGQHSRKIGDRVVKGPWRGMPIFTLTLEERATCPATCRHWRDCYGNKMNWSERLMPGHALEWRLGKELRDLQARHSYGFVVRLHVLGDFYSTGYVKRWLSWLRRFPALRVFGYTARQSTDPIGRLVRNASDRLWDRFAVRTSNGYMDQDRGAFSVYQMPAKPRIAAGIVCPAQTGRSDCCGTCGLCWGTRANVVFVAH